MYIQRNQYIELYRAKDTTAESAAQAILSHVGRYGTPMRSSQIAEHSSRMN